MKKVLIVGILIIIGFLVVLMFIPLGIEPLTEVYFENHTELPKHLFLGEYYDFMFTVHNLEEQDMNYEYIVEVFDEEGKFMFELGRDEFFLENEESKTFTQDFMFTGGFDRAQVNVQVVKIPLDEKPWFKKKLWWPDPNYPTEINIHLWVEEIVGTTITITDD